MEHLASIYGIGSVLMGIILVADNVRLIRRGGNLDTEGNGKAVGWTFFFMIVEVWWAGTSALVLWQGLVRPLVPVLYLIYVGVALSSGIVANMVKGPIRSFALWQVRAALAFSAVFAAIAAYELIYGSGANAA